VEFECSMRSGTVQRSTEKMIATQSIFQDFQRKPLMQLHPRRAEQCSNRLCRPPLASDHLPQIFRMHSQLQHGNLRPFDGLHLYVLGMIHEGSGNGFNQILHRVPGNGAPGETGGRANFRKAPKLSDLLLLKETAYGVARLRAKSHPILDTVRIKLDLRRFL